MPVVLAFFLCNPGAGADLLVQERPHEPDRRARTHAHGGRLRLTAAAPSADTTRRPDHAGDARPAADLRPGAVRARGASGDVLLSARAPDVGRVRPEDGDARG